MIKKCFKVETASLLRTFTINHSGQCVTENFSIKLLQSTSFLRMLYNIFISLKSEPFLLETLMSWYSVKYFWKQIIIWGKISNFSRQAREATVVRGFMMTQTFPRH